MILPILYCILSKSLDIPVLWWCGVLPSFLALFPLQHSLGWWCCPLSATLAAGAYLCCSTKSTRLSFPPDHNTTNHIPNLRLHQIFNFKIHRKTSATSLGNHSQWPAEKENLQVESLREERLARMDTRSNRVTRARLVSRLVLRIACVAFIWRVGRSLAHREVERGEERRIDFILAPTMDRVIGHKQPLVFAICDHNKGNMQLSNLPRSILDQPLEKAHLLGVATRLDNQQLQDMFEFERGIEVEATTASKLRRMG